MTNMNIAMIRAKTKFMLDLFKDRLSVAGALSNNSPVNLYFDPTPIRKNRYGLMALSTPSGDDNNIWAVSYSIELEPEENIEFLTKYHEYYFPVIESLTQNSIFNFKRDNIKYDNT